LRKSKKHFVHNKNAWREQCVFQMIIM